MECNNCLPLSQLVKVDITVENVVDQQEFNCLAILTDEPNCGVGGIASPVDAATMVLEYTSFADVAAQWDSNCEVYQAAQHAFAQTPRVAIVKVMYMNAGGNIPAQLDELFECENCQGIIAPEIADDTAQVLAIADWVELRAGQNFYFTDSHDADTLDPNNTTNIAAIVAAAGYKYTSVYYHSDATEQFAAAAISYGLGQDLDLIGSSFTMAFKQLVGVNPDFFSQSEIVAVTGFLPSTGCSTDFGHFANAYTCVGGVNMMLYGAMGDGNFFDTILLSEYMKARIQEAVAQVFINGSVPFTQTGVLTITNTLSFVLSQFEANGWIEDYLVLVPSVANTTVADRACRILECPQFTARLTGRVHSTCIIGELRF